jgi:hypothetical protein
MLYEMRISLELTFLDLALFLAGHDSLTFSRDSHFLSSFFFLFNVPSAIFVFYKIILGTIFLYYHNTFFTFNFFFSSYLINRKGNRSLRVYLIKSLVVY